MSVAFVRRLPPIMHAVLVFIHVIYVLTVLRDGLSIKLKQKQN